MRTTADFDDQLLIQAKLGAAASEVLALPQLIEDTLGIPHQSRECEESRTCKNDHVERNGDMARCGPRQWT